MRVIAKRTLKQFWHKHSECENPLKIWFQQVSSQEWKSFNEMRRIYGAADSVGNDLYVFNIKGNKYRLVAKIDFRFRLVFIKFIGTHEDYDKLVKTGIKNL